MTTSAARRVFALLLGLSMLHLMMVSADRACASHDAGGVMPVAMAHDGMSGAAMSAMHVDAASRTARAPQECATPMTEHCCEAMTGCTLATEVAAAMRGTTPRIARAAMPARSIALLASFQPAPEPPPPKA